MRAPELEAEPGLGDRGQDTGPARRRRWPLWLRLVLGLAVFGVVLALVLRAPSAMSQFAGAFRHFRLLRLPWLAVSVVLETASLACSALAQRRLLQAGKASIPFPTMFELAVASTAVAKLVPVGFAPANGWLVQQYHLRRAPIPLALWSILAAGFCSTVTALCLVLVGAQVAGLWSTPGLVVSAAVLVGGSTSVVLVLHKLSLRREHLGEHLHNRAARTLARIVERSMHYRISPLGGTTVLVLSGLNWLLDAGCLVLAFVVLGFSVPWHGALFAYAAAQVVGSITFLSIGTVEGGMVGALLLTGTKAAPALAATLMYRVIAYWLVAGVGAILFVLENRRHRAGTPAEHGHETSAPSYL